MQGMDVEAVLYPLLGFVMARITWNVWHPMSVFESFWRLMYFQGVGNINEPHHEKTNILHMQNQRRRSAVQ